MKKRKDWDTYFLDIMKMVSDRATCDRGKSGCIIVSKHRRVLATGYVGSPTGGDHCDLHGHQLADNISEDGGITTHCIRTVHAEVNAVAQAARFGVPVDGSTMYITMEPCYSCAKMIVQIGIKRVVCLYRYQAGKLTRKLFKDCKVDLKVVFKSVNPY
jgi:dCMP deaminase